MITDKCFLALAIGLGIGYTNATLLGIPAWANIVAMFALAMGYAVSAAGEKQVA